MSTRAMYTFKDEHDEYHIYKHHDGYPSGAVEFIGLALPNAWELPRFEADEFAAAFVAGNKRGLSGGGGGVRIMKSGDWEKVAPGDIEYRYEIECVDKTLHITAWGTNCSYPSNEWSTKLLFSGSFEEFQKFAETS